MKNPAACAIVLLLLLTGAAPPAFPGSPKTRAEAVAGLTVADPETRAEAIEWVALHGRFKDAALLQERLRDADPVVRLHAEQGLWRLWTRSGDPGIDALMERASDQMQTGRLAEAIATLSGVIVRRPDFAEGWNRRATAYFLAGEYRKSIADCNEVLKRNPGHFGALSGLGQIQVQLEDYEQALKWFRRALEVNPNMEGARANIRQVEQKLKQRRAHTI